MCYCWKYLKAGHLRRLSTKLLNDRDNIHPYSVAFKGQTGQVKAGVFETVLDWETKWMFTIRMLEGLTVA